MLKILAIVDLYKSYQPRSHPSDTYFYVDGMLYNNHAARNNMWAKPPGMNEPAITACAAQVV